MPTYFPENNTPQSADSINRSLQKINGLLAIRGGSITDRSGTIATLNVSQQVAAANESRAYFVFQNISDTTMYVNFDAAATVDSNSIKVNSNGSITFDSGWVPRGAVNVICSSASKKWVAKEGN
jgi:hypothetical protein